ncbi:MAG: DUF2225 domain-containing protein [Lachnospiraceae bacterium]|nr:DUF2225 domain-containing protein [Lachnospiraceae bacterium]
MGLFEGMEGLGLSGLKEINVIDKPRTTDTDREKAAAQLERKEEDYIFDKKYQCPVCDLGFTSKCVKTGKLQRKKTDTDLRPVYDFMDPLKYDVVSCSYCGYSSLTRYYGRLSNHQIMEIKNNIGKTFKGLEDKDGPYTYDEAILRHKLALICSVVKKAKNGERAYTALKTAWVIRGKRLSNDKNDPENKALYNDELECLQNAYDGFVLAISSEPFPIAGMDENTLKYIMADLARKLKKFEESARLIGSVITSKSTNKRLKDEALNLKELIKQDIAKSR